MSVLKLDPPPDTDDIRVLRAYVSELYDAVVNMIYDLDGDNLSEEFLNTLNVGSEK